MKKYFIGMLALVLAVGFSSFTKYAKVRTIDDLVFTYDGTGSFQNVANMETEANWDFEGTTDDIAICDAAAALKGCKIVVSASELNIDNTPTVGQTLADVSSDLAVDAAKPTGQTFANVLSVQRSGYSATVSNRIP